MSNPMAAQIESIPALIRGIVPAYTEAIQRVVRPEWSRSIRRIYLTGCGDSHHAALGSEMAFEYLAGLPTEALTALQFARYSADSLPEPTTCLVMTASVSGEVSRSLEGLLLARRAGALTLALTATPASRIARAAHGMVDTTQPPFADPPGLIIPGVRSYVANQVAFLLLAIELGAQRGRLSAEEAAALRVEIARLADAAEQTLAACQAPAQRLAEEWRDAREFVFLGGGPNYASALFSAAKVLEASGDPALGQDLEEWAHLQYFAKQADTPTFVITAGERDHSRAAEIVVAARQIGRRVALVAPLSAGELAEAAHTHLPFGFTTPAGPGGSLREMFSPVLSAIPTSLVAAYRAEVLGEPYFRDFGGGRSREGGGGISRIRTSHTLGLEQLE